MNRRTLLYIAIIILPLAVLGSFGLRAARAEKRSWRTELADLYRKDLERLDEEISEVLTGLERETEKLSYLFDADSGQIRAAVRHTDLVREVFRIDADGLLDFPPGRDLNADEKAFLERTAALWENGQRFLFPAEDGSYRKSGWFRYYEADAVSFIYWIRAENGRILGFDVYREFILARVLNAIGKREERAENGNNRFGSMQADENRKIVLYDELGRMIFTSGAKPVGEKDKAFLSIPVAAELGGWKAEVYLSSDLLSGSSSLALPLSFAALTIVLLAAAFLFWREYTREIREAGKRVSFVNQVSHELKTPLTNIRLYAELLDGQIKDGSKGKKYAEVICQESERLGRLISNVLSFSGKAGHIHYSEINPADSIRAVVAMYTPRLEKNTLTIRCSSDPGRTGLFDRDIIEQICWNLINNAEKYAGSGILDISMELDGKVFSAEFKDSGPGIPRKFASRIFEPFFRIRSDLTEGVSGSGLGLAISKSMAGKHGGDLVLLPSAAGTRFRLTLQAGEENENTDR